MKYGGVMGQSKFDILQSIDPAYRPKSILVKGKTAPNEVMAAFRKNGFEYPIVVKPNIGERGIKVEKIESNAELIRYHNDFSEDFIIQEFIPYEHEVGVLYYRYPGEKSGHISSVVIKGFLYLTGDGKHAFEQLLEKMPRAYSKLNYFREKFAGDLKRVLHKDEKVLLEPIGNHNRGTTFLNGNHLINEKLVHVFDKISESISGFYYGRFDIRVKSIEDLYEGKDIVILELNGVSSEPAHLYDPSYKLLRAYYDIACHMKIIYRIARENYRKGYKRASVVTFLKDLRRHFSLNRKRKKMAGR